jgi:hypothetical protein
MTETVSAAEQVLSVKGDNLNVGDLFFDAVANAWREVERVYQRGAAYFVVYNTGTYRLGEAERVLAKRGTRACA